MSPNSSKEAPGLNLPPPVGEQPPVVPAATEAGLQPEVAAQAAPAAAERAPSSAAAGAVAAQPAVPFPVGGDDPSLLQQPQQDDVSATSQSAKTGLIKDQDLIEKEWVEKAKKIVEQTRNDPHEQSEQLTMVKADYMKKRYNKTIKVDT